MVVKGATNREKFEAAIYQSLQADPEPAATIAKLRQQVADNVGSDDWQAAIVAAVKRFEART